MGKPIQTSQVTSLDAATREGYAQIKAIKDELVKKNPSLNTNPAGLLDDPRIKKMGLSGTEGQQVVSQASFYDPKRMPPAPDTSSFKPIDFNSKDKVLTYTAIDAKNGVPVPVVFKDFFGVKQGSSYVQAPLFVTKLRIEQPAPPPAKGQPQQPPTVQEVTAGPFKQGQLDQLLSSSKTISEISGSRSNVVLYSNDTGDVGVAIDRTPSLNPLTIQPQFLQLPVWSDSVQTIQSLIAHTPGVNVQPTRVTPVVMINDHHEVPWWRFFVAILFGIAMAFAIEWLTDYYVSTHKRPVQEVAGVSTAGPAPMIIQGFALAAESSVFSVFAIVLALIMPLIIFPPSEYGGSYILSFYGIALVGLGLLTTTGFILAMDTFGPISDNAQGVFEMSGAGHDSEAGSKAVQRLDAAGNTTKALTKGFAIATAVVAAVALFHSYLQDANLSLSGIRIDVPEIFLGLLIGGAAPYLFAAFAINAVGRASFQLINEVRKQFREDPGILAGTSRPNYGRCVAIVTEAAQKELLGPAILAIALPIAVAFGFSIGKGLTTIGGAQYNLTGAQALGGFLAGAILSGQLMAVLLANSGGIWDNAKKLIEDGLFGGKGSDAHKAGVVCDTVGDPFKDTAGPAMNPLIKVMNLVSLLLAPYVIAPWSTGVLITVTVVALAALAFSVWWSKRASFSAALNQVTEQAGHTPLAYEGEDHEHAAVGASRKRITVADEDEES